MDAPKLWENSHRQQLRMPGKGRLPRCGRECADLVEGGQEDKAPWLLVHLGQCRRVHAVQINFADDAETVGELPEGAGLTGEPGRGRYIEERSFATRWFLEISTDGEHWFKMEDWRDTDTDLPHNLLVWEDGLPAAYIRLTVIDTSYHRPACISGLRVFGRGCGSAPAPVTEAKAIRSDGMSMNVTWKEVSSYNEIASWNKAAMGYEVLWGHTPEKLYHSYRVFGKNQVEIRALMSNVEQYYVRIDAFNENGIAEGRCSLWKTLCKRLLTHFGGRAIK